MDYIYIFRRRLHLGEENLLKIDFKWSISFFLWKVQSPNFALLMGTPMEIYYFKLTFLLQWVLIKGRMYTKIQLDLSGIEYILGKRWFGVICLWNLSPKCGLWFNVYGRLDLTHHGFELARPQDLKNLTTKSFLRIAWKYSAINT